MGMVFLCTIMPFAAFFLRQAMEKLITVSGKRWKRLLMLFGCFLLLGTIIYIGDPVNILLTISFFLLSVQIACKGSFWKKATIGLIFSGSIFAFSTLRDNFLLPLDVRYMNPGQAVLISSLYTLLFSFFLYIGIRKFAPDKEYKLSDSMWRLLLLLAMTPIGIILSVVVLHDRYRMYQRDTGFHLDYFALSVIALFSIIGLLWAVTVLAKQWELEERTMLEEINHSYYESMEQQHFAIRRLKHDLANHLSAVMAMPEQQRESYIRRLSEDSAVTRPLQYCGDTTVNAVLSVKEEQMKRYHIRLEAEIDIARELPFEKPDICALFANALDNAAEACRKMEEDKRKVLLKSKAQKGLFCLEVRNPAVSGARDSAGKAVSRVWQDGSFPQTSKTDKENHGIGLRSMKGIVERYHGSMDVKVREDVFEVFLYIPMG